MPTSAQDLIAAARLVVPEVAAAAVAAESPADRGVVIDVRDRHELDAGTIPGAAHLSRGNLELDIETHVPDRDTPITVYCEAGSRSLLAGRSLKELGYRNVRSLAGGFRSWRDHGFDVTREPTLTTAQHARYQRQIRLPEIGEAGQRKLLSARVLLIGAGGLGSPVALYLAAAGVGTLGVVDPDTVDASNLHRQILHTEARVGTAKTESTRLALGALNSDVRIETHAEALTSANARVLFDSYDVVVNGCDNFPTRYLANDMAVFTGTPLVDGSVNRFDGEVTTLLPGTSACYRCRYPEPPAPGAVPSCADAGVLGVLPGIVGTLQAAETLKLLLGRGRSLAGRLLRFDALEMTFREYTVAPDPECAVCSERPTITEPIDYAGFCGSELLPA